MSVNHPISLACPRCAEEAIRLEAEKPDSISLVCDACGHTIVASEALKLLSPEALEVLRMRLHAEPVAAA